MSRISGAGAGIGGAGAGAAASASASVVVAARPPTSVGLLDLDAFYAQVCQLRLGLPAVRSRAPASSLAECAVPASAAAEAAGGGCGLSRLHSSLPAPTRRPRAQGMAVVCQQWDNIIALTPNAKRAGVARHVSVLEARARCAAAGLPFRAVHVEVVDADGRPRLPAPGEAVSQADNKVSLHMFRAASVAVFKRLLRMCGGDAVARASCDEAYLSLDDAALRVLAGLLRSWPPRVHAEDEVVAPPPAPAQPRSIFDDEGEAPAAADSAAATYSERSPPLPPVPPPAPSPPPVAVAADMPAVFCEAQSPADARMDPLTVPPATETSLGGPCGSALVTGPACVGPGPLLGPYWPP